MDFRKIRRIIIIAMFSDDVLMQSLVLKGGNLLGLVLGVGERASLDVDLSIEQEFRDIEDAKRRLIRALRDRFDAEGMVVFDEHFKVIPPEGTPDATPWWGGYQLEFKLLDRSTFEALGKRPQKRAIQARTVSPSTQDKRFRIDISKHEYCGKKVAVEVDGYTVYAYSPEMVAIEKLRALCQQMPEYPHLSDTKKRARARDFYDIHAILRQGDIDLASAENLELCANIFEAKRVPTKLLGRLPSEELREYHRADWPAVKEAVSGELMEFDFYFEFVAGQVEKLKSLWEE